MSTISPTDFIAENREIVSFVTRMIISSSSIEMKENTVIMSTDKTLADIFQSSKVKSELLQAMSNSHPGKKLKIKLV